MSEKGRIRMADDLAFVDATAQAELVSSGQVHPGELVDAAIDRVENPEPLHAIEGSPPRRPPRTLT